MTQLPNNVITPLQLLNLYFSNGKSTGNRGSKLWRKFNELLTWDAILNKGFQADLCPLLYYILTKWEPGSELSAFSLEPSAKLPNDLTTKLRSHYYASLRHNLLLLNELNKVLKAFNETGIDVIVLKGAALAQTVYPDIALRPMGDMDLLVKKENLEKAEKLLADLGYDKFIKKDSKRHPFHNTYLRIVNEESFVIEIHWNLVRKIFYTNINLNELWVDAIPTDSLGTKVLRLSPLHSLLYLCWHGSHHSFKRLLWLCDIAQIIKINERDINWDLVDQTSREWKIKKPVFLSLYLVRSLLNEGTSIQNFQGGNNWLQGKVFYYLICKIQSKIFSNKDSKYFCCFLSSLLIKSQKDKTKFLLSKITETWLKE